MFMKIFVRQRATLAKIFAIQHRLPIFASLWCSLEVKITWINKGQCSLFKRQAISRMSQSEANLSDVRKPYKEGNYLKECELESKNPLKLFDIWFSEARRTESIKEPNAMTVATVNSEGKPTARLVLLKNYGPEGFTFYTSYRSAKGQDLQQTPYAALVLYWVDLCRSVRIEGLVEKVPASVSEEYFQRRPRASQVAAHVSQHQSSVIKNRQALDDAAANIEQKFGDELIPKPDYWGGYLVIPDKIEFWQGQSSRMSDRILFVKNSAGETDEGWNCGEDGWVFQRLQP